MSVRSSVSGLIAAVLVAGAATAADPIEGAENPDAGVEPYEVFDNVDQPNQTDGLEDATEVDGLPDTGLDPAAEPAGTEAGGADPQDQEGAEAGTENSEDREPKMPEEPTGGDGEKETVVDDPIRSGLLAEPPADMNPPVPDGLQGELPDFSAPAKAK